MAYLVGVEPSAAYGPSPPGLRCRAPLIVTHEPGEPVTSDLRDERGCLAGALTHGREADTPTVAVRASTAQG